MVKKILYAMFFVLSYGFSVPSLIDEIKNTNFEYFSYIQTNEVFVNQVFYISNRVRRKIWVAGKLINYRLSDDSASFFITDITNLTNKYKKTIDETDEKGISVKKINAGNKEGHFFLSVFFINNAHNYIHHSVFFKYRVINKTKFFGIISALFLIILSSIIASIVYFRKDKKNYFISLMMAPQVVFFSTEKKNKYFFIIFPAITLISILLIISSILGLYIFPQLFVFFVIILLSSYFIDIKKIDMVFLKILIFQILLVIFLEKYGDTNYIKMFFNFKYFMLFFIIYAIFVPSLIYNYSFLIGLKMHNIITLKYFIIMISIITLIYIILYISGFYYKNKKVNSND